MKSLSTKKVLNILLVTKMVKNRPLCIFLPKISAYRRDFHETEYMFILTKDDELL